MTNIHTERNPSVKIIQGGNSFPVGIHLIMMRKEIGYIEAEEVKDDVHFK